MNIWKMFESISWGDLKYFLLLWLPIICIVLYGIVHTIGTLQFSLELTDHIKDVGYTVFTDKNDVVKYFYFRTWEDVLPALLICIVLFLLMLVIVCLPPIKKEEGMVKKG